MKFEDLPRTKELKRGDVVVHVEKPELGRLYVASEILSASSVPRVRLNSVKNGFSCLYPEDLLKKVPDFDPQFIPVNVARDALCVCESLNQAIQNARSANRARAYSRPFHHVIELQPDGTLVLHEVPAEEGP